MHEKLGNLFVEKIQVDSKDPAAVARKIMGQIKKNSPKQNVVVEAITTEKDTDEPKASTFKWKTSQKDTDSAISDLRKELKELRRQIKKLQADRDND